MEDSEDDDSDGNEEEGDGMVLDAQNGHFARDGLDYSDSDEESHSLEHFDEETEADTDMAVSFQILIDLIGEYIIVMLQL